MAPTVDPGTCPACAVTRWEWVATTTAAAGWRTVRNDLAELGEYTADSNTSHDCTRTAGGADVTDDAQWALGWDACRPDSSRPVPLFWPIDRHGTPQTGWPLSTRSITSIVAVRLAAAARADRRPVTNTPGRVDMRATWGSDDHDRVVAARQAATERLASFEADLDEADAYAEAILARLDAELTDRSP